MGEIVASGLVIVVKGKILLSNDYEDKFFKIPGGKVKEGENLKDCALREFKEETGLDAIIGMELSMMKLSKKPQTGEIIDIYLHHFIGELVEEIGDFEEFEFAGHKIRWIDLEDIKQDKIEVAPNVLFLIEKKEI